MLTLFTDYRLGGIPCHYLSEQPEHFMRVPPEIRKSVFFICVKTSQNQIDELEVAGTGFFFGLNEPEIDSNFVYMVTAKHVINAVKKYSADGFVWLRMNKKSGDVGYVRSTFDQWIYHPTDESIDVAVISYAPDRQEFDYLLIPDKMALTENHIAYSKVGAGDEVFITGMFVNHVGRKRNIPIIRTGNIAMMPEEPLEIAIENDKPYPAEVYLIESRSIGGLSGSPVFVHKPQVIVDEGQIKYAMNGEVIHWLGLIHGHWDVKPELDSIMDDVKSRTVNMGIAIAVPAGKVLEVINQPLLVEKREKRIKELKQKHLPKADSPLDGNDKPADDDIFTREDFEKALKKVSRPDKDN